MSRLQAVCPETIVWNGVLVSVIAGIIVSLKIPNAWRHCVGGVEDHEVC